MLQISWTGFRRPLVPRLFLWNYYDCTILSSLEWSLGGTSGASLLAHLHRSFQVPCGTCDDLTVPMEAVAVLPAWSGLPSFTSPLLPAVLSPPLPSVLGPTADPPSLRSDAIWGTCPYCTSPAALPLMPPCTSLRQHLAQVVINHDIFAIIFNICPHHYTAGAMAEGWRYLFTTHTHGHINTPKHTHIHKHTHRPSALIEYSLNWDTHIFGIGFFFIHAFIHLSI